MIDAFKFPWNCHTMITFVELSSHYSWQRSDYCRQVHDIIDGDFFHRGDTSTLFLKWAPSSNANSFPRHHDQFGKM